MSGEPTMKRVTMWDATQTDDEARHDVWGADDETRHEVGATRLSRVTHSHEKTGLVDVQ
jgi:hypothetical protein